MKKLLLALLLIMTLITVGGCGSKAVDPNSAVTIKWDGLSYTYDGNALNFVTYAGDTAQVIMSAGSYSVMLDSAKDVTNITVNSQGILQENMDTYKGLFYYQEYLGSKTTGAMEIGPDTWGVCQTGGGTPSILAKEMYEIISTLPLTSGTVLVNVADAFTFGNDYDKLECRADKIIIPGIAQVVPGTIHPSMESYTLYKEDGTAVSAMYGSTEAYDYYYYADYTIQLYKGGNINDYIKIK